MGAPHPGNDGTWAVLLRRSITCDLPRGRHRFPPPVLIDESPMSPMSTAGRFCWHELMTTDPDGAIAFYGKLAGWTTEAHAQDPSYRMWKTPKVTIGGVMKLPEEAQKMGSPSHWVPYVEVTDVDGTVHKAQSMGGKVYVPGTDIPTMGRFAVLADHQGATFAIYRGSAGLSPDTEPGPGEFSWHEMIAADLDAAWRFYSSLFGWEKREALDMGQAGIYQVFRNAGGSRDLGGMYKKPADMPAPPHWLCYVNVASAAKAGEFTRKSGGQVMMGPMEVPGGGHIIAGVDPQGAAFATFEPPKSMKPAKSKPKKKAAKKKKAPAKKKTKSRKAKPKKRPAKKTRKRR